LKTQHHIFKEELENLVHVMPFCS